MKVIVLILTLISLNLYGQCPPTNATLNDYIMIAASNNKELVAAFDRWKAALEVILEVDTLPDPRFGFSYFITPIETRAGPMRTSYRITQTFPWLGKLKLKGKKAQQEALVLKSRFDALLLEVVLNVKKAYYEYAYLFRSIAVTQEVLEILQTVNKELDNTYPIVDILRAQVELDKTEAHFHNLENLRRPLIAKLNATMNLPIETPLPMPNPIPTIEIPYSDECLHLSLRENNPCLLAYDFQAQAGALAVSLAKKEFFPDLTFKVETIRIGGARSPNVFNSGKAPWIATVAFNIPFWQQKRRAAVRKAQWQLASTVEEQQSLEENLSADLELALYKYQHAHSKMEFYGNTLVPKAKESLNLTLDVFKKEKAYFNDFIDAERTFLELTLAYERSIADRAIYLAEIEALTAQECCLFPSSICQTSK